MVCLGRQSLPLIYLRTNNYKSRWIFLLVPICVDQIITLENLVHIYYENSIPKNQIFHQMIGDKVL